MLHNITLTNIYLCYYEVYESFSLDEELNIMTLQLQYIICVFNIILFI